VAKAANQPSTNKEHIMPSLEWTQEITDDGVDHIATFTDKKDQEHKMIVSPADLDGKRWWSLEHSDSDVLDVGDEDVFFSSPDAAKDYAEQLKNVFLGHLPHYAGAINYNSAGEQEWSPIP
jgi:hypothetical protein